MTQSVLILGATGKFGAAAKTAFLQAGWKVTCFNRRTDRLETAVKGMDVVVNALNPPSYHLWHKALLKLHTQVIEALTGSDTIVLVPGNVYVFGQQTPAPWSEDTPHAARNPLGQLRIEMEQAYRASDVRTIILRGGDFWDTRPSGNWFDRILVKDVPKGVLSYPGPFDAPHSWAYLPDMTRAAVALCEIGSRLPRFADIPFPGFTLTAHELAAVVGQVAERPIRLKPFDWRPIKPLSFVMPSLRGLPEMRYLWETPHRLDSTRFDSLLPAFQATSLEEALSRAMAHLNVQPVKHAATGNPATI